jgi:hypothetical protein
MEDNAPIDHIQKTAEKIVQNHPNNEFIPPKTPPDGFMEGNSLGQVGVAVYSNLNVRYKNVSSKFKKNYEEIKWDDKNDKLKSKKSKGVKLTQIYKNN